MRRYIAGLALVVSTPAWAGPEMKAVTPSGTTEMMFRNTTVQEASGKLANQCVANGLTLVSSTPGEVVCEIKMSGMKSALAQALIGNSYSTPPRNLIKLTIAQIGPHARVQAARWMETQMAFGQVRRQEFNSDDTHNECMTFMEMAGAAFVPGTSFPNHAYVGTGPLSAQEATYQGKKAVGAVVRAPEAGGPFEQSGAQPGDVLVAVNGKTFKNGGDLDKRFRGIPAGGAMTVTVLRAGQPVTLNMAAGRRPSIPMEDLGAAQPAQVAAAAPLTAAPTSVADELAKLADLRGKGIITQAEFDAQKAKLLAR